MASFGKQLLSGSTNGRPIQVAATATPGTLIHTAVTGTTDFDEIWIYGVLTGAPTVLLTIEFGGTGAGDLITHSFATQDEPVLIVAGQPLQNALVVRAFAGTTNVINLWGFVNRITA